MDETTEYLKLPGLLGKLGKMTSIRDTELLEQSLLKTLGPLLGVLDTSLYRFDESNDLVRVLHHHRSRETDPEGEARIVERTEEVHNLADIPEAVESVISNVRLLGKPCSRRVGEELVIAYPMTGCGKVCGYFVFQRDHDISPSEDAVVRGVLEVFSNYYSLLDVSRRDQLTGLLNRQSLEQNFDHIWHMLAEPVLDADKGAGRRHAVPTNYWFAVLDIDHFKKINDVHGHIIGDEVLLLAARLLSETFRNTDLIYRYGGEEFVAIISADTSEIAMNVFERARLAIEAHVFPRVGHITLSGGYSRADPKVLPQEVLSRADRALYQAKSDGRNRVYEFERLVQNGVFAQIPYGDMEMF